MDGIRIKEKLRKGLEWITPNMLVLLLACVCIAIYFCALPQHWDDSWYNYASYPWLKAHGYTELNRGVNIFRDGIPWDAVAQTWYVHYLYDNARLADILLPVMLFLPSWFNACLMSLCVGYTVVALCRLAGVNPWRSPLMPLMLCLLSWTLPWRENLSVLAFQLNYVAATALCLMLVRFVLRRAEEKGPAIYVLALLFGFVVGSWHEGFAVPIGGGLGVLWLAFKRFRTRIVLLVGVGMLIGFTLIMMAPGIQDRARTTVAPPALWVFRVVAENSVIWVVAMLITVWMCFRLGWKRLWSDPVFVFAQVSAFISLWVCTLTSHEMRAEWWAYVMSCLIIVYLLKLVSPKLWSGYSWRNAVILVPAIALIFVFWGYVSVYGLKLRSEHSRLMSEWRANPGKTRWSRYVERKDFPMPCAMVFFSSWMNDVWVYPLMYDAFVRAEDYKSPFKYDSTWGVIPESLRYVTADSGTEMPGGSGIRVKDGHFFMLEQGEISEALKSKDASKAEMPLRVDFGKGYVCASAQFLSFRSEADGKRYLFIAPDASWFVTFFRHIKAIAPVETDDMSIEVTGIFHTLDMFI